MDVMSKLSGSWAFPEYHAVLMPGHVWRIHFASLMTSIGSASPPMKQKQVIAEEYVPISLDSMSSVISSPSSLQSQGL